MIKYIFLGIFFFYLSDSLGQNLDSLRYSFLNEKIAKDSLTNFPLSNYIMSIDTTCYVQTYLSTDNQDTSIHYHCHGLEPLLSDYGLGNYVDSTDIIKNFNKVYEDNKLQSIVINLTPEFRQQVRLEKNERWDKLKLHEQLEYADKQKRKKSESQGQYSMSFPIFFGEMDKAIVFVSFYHGPLYAQGYVEYYEKTENNKWKMIKRYMIWMS